MIFNAFILCVAICAIVPACLFLVNLLRFKAPAVLQVQSDETHVAVLIPARNEEFNISEVLKHVLASYGIKLEVLVYDDASTDATSAIVRKFAQHDPRVRLIDGVALPEGWNGKQHACWRLAQASTAALLLFLDADVRVEPEAIARCVAQRQVSDVALLSGFPRIVTVTWMEWLVLPLVHFVLLGFLPMRRMQRTTIPAYAAGCGQFMLATREAYFACGGHAAIRETRHDGLRLPNLFRKYELRTDICDLTSLASVRMYSSAAEVWNGLAKNATEGLGSPVRIAPLTLMLLMGQVVPIILATLCVLLLISVCVVGAQFDEPRRVHSVFLAVGVATACSFLPRIIAARKFKQPFISVALHPLGVLMLLSIQWYALVRKLMGRPVGWRAREYSS